MPLEGEALAGAAAAEEGALAIWRDVDVEKAGHCLRRAMDVGCAYAALRQFLEDSITNCVLTNLGDQGWAYFPASQGDGAVGGDSSAMQFDVVREALFTGVRPSSHTSDDIGVDVTENNDGGAAGHRLDSTIQIRRVPVLL